jgi:hypothetical protein
MRINRKIGCHPQTSMILSVYIITFLTLCYCRVIEANNTTVNTLSEQEKKDGWQLLWDGKTLAGWVQKGGQAKYEVSDGQLIGRTVPNTPNSFLCTEKTYADFILEYDFKVDPRLNSGVQIRSECFDQPRQIKWKGNIINIPAGRVHGYQIEIDPDVPRGRMWSAGIYDEGRRGWLFPADGETGSQGKAFSEQGIKIFKPNEWNHVRVEAIGSSIKTWLNGTACAAIEDSMTPKGFIALQVHSLDNASWTDAEVRWRNIRIKEVSAVTVEQTSTNTLSEQEKKDGWKLLWDGKTTEGWHSPKSDSFPTKGWEIKNGELCVESFGNGESASGGDIITKERYSDFELMVDFKCSPGCNSGIKYFVQPNLDPITGTGAKTSVGSAIGLEFQILDDANHPDAKAGRNGNRTLGSLYDLLTAAATKKPNPMGQWNTARIIANGNHVEHWLNGDKILEYERNSQAFKELVAQSKYNTIPGFGEWPDGHILLQEHGSQVTFRNIKIRVISNVQNTLSEQEKKDGWKLLWDGKTTEGWRSATSESFPAKGWTIKDGEFTIETGSQGGGGDIITKEKFSNFELSFDYKTSPGCNSGIKYLVQPGTGAGRSLGAMIGPEFQILDDATHPDAKAGRNGNRKEGSVYDILPAANDKKSNPIGQWSTGRIIVNGTHVEHWLNGSKILEFERNSQTYRDAIAQSKFNVVPGYGEWPDGYILLQDHGNVVSFRNIKIRILTDKSNQ